MYARLLLIEQETKFELIFEKRVEFSVLGPHQVARFSVELLSSGFDMDRTTSAQGILRKSFNFGGKITYSVIFRIPFSIRSLRTRQKARFPAMFRISGKK